MGILSRAGTQGDIHCLKTSDPVFYRRDVVRISETRNAEPRGICLCFCSGGGPCSVGPRRQSAFSAKRSGRKRLPRPQVNQSLVRQAQAVSSHSSSSWRLRFAWLVAGFTESPHVGGDTRLLLSLDGSFSWYFDCAVLLQEQSHLGFTGRQAGVQAPGRDRRPCLPVPSRRCSVMFFALNAG